MANGDLLYPKKGRQPPTPPVGYMADETDPWVMHKILKSCKHRNFINTPTPCGVKRYTYWCLIDNFVTNWSRCDACIRAEAGEGKQINDVNINITKRCDDGSYL